MGNSTSRVVGCFAPFGNGKDAMELDFLEPLDEGLGHSFCYVRPVILDSPAITPSNSERFMVDSSTFDSETNSGSFRQEIAEDSLSLGLQRPNKNFSETTFKTISGASVSANASTARTGNSNMMFPGDAQEPAASFESTASFAAIPLQPVPHGSGPLNGFMSGPLERGFASGPLEKGGGFMSGPLERGIFMSGPLDNTDRSNFSAPLAYGRRRVGLGGLVRSVSGPMRSAFSRKFAKHFSDRSWMHRFFQPMTQFMGHSKNAKNHPDFARNCVEFGPSESDYNDARNLQWAHGKAGEDRVHVVLSEEQGWLFVGIYDGFSGPDAPDFLMSNLYRAIDKELEGLLWDYEDKAGKDVSESTPVQSSSIGESQHCGSGQIHNYQSPDDGLESKHEIACKADQSNEYKTQSESKGDKGCGAESVEVRNMKNVDIEDNDKNNASGTDQNCIMKCHEKNIDAVGSAMVQQMDGSSRISGQSRRSVRLFELLQMELMEEYAGNGSLSASEVGSRRIDSFSFQSDDLCSRVSVSAAQLVSCSGREGGSGQLKEAADKRENDGATSKELSDSKQKISSSNYISGYRQLMKRNLIGAKLRKIYRKQKSLRKKLFPWSYDWHREQISVEDRMVDSSVGIRRCKSGAVDHDAVLHAMARALQITEEAYMEMVESTLDNNPELALMGSCVLVMLMKDQDVYVMNLGDSRVVLAQERPCDRYNNLSVAKDDLRLRNRSRESLTRMELDRISEESPMHDPNHKVCNVSKNQELSIYKLRVKALQLSTDHCTGVEEEVARIKAEHLDDAQAVFNDRVKGQLKVTRAFGAAFLKKSKFNEALLEMFRIDYIGASPYVSCSPAVLHHRLCSNDRFLVLSSDGLYQYFSNDEVVSQVAWFMENMPEGDPAQYLIAELLFRAAKKNGMNFHELLDIPQGDRRKYHDDVSVMVISLEGRIWRSSG